MRIRCLISLWFTVVLTACEGSTFTCEPIPARVIRLSRLEYDNAVSALFGPSALAAVRRLEDERVVQFSNNAAALVVDDARAGYYQWSAEEIAAVAAPSVSRTPCFSSGTPPQTCARTWISQFGRMAFRRPLSRNESSALLAVFASRIKIVGVTGGIRSVIEAVLQSPSFLYRTELGGDAAAKVVRMSPYEVASALSFGVTASPPDSELLDLAASGELNEPRIYRAQVDRLMATPGAKARLHAFFFEWLSMDGIEALEKDPETYPGFTPSIRTAMRLETELFFDHAIFSGEGALRDVFSSRATFVNDELAAFYGWAPPGSGDKFTQVVAGDGRRGLLSQGSLMASFAHYNETSPVHRGKFVRLQLLCQSLPPPPVEVLLHLTEGDTLTTRERYQRHSDDRACYGCHRMMDPIGFGFEDFGGDGRRRSRENGKPIDASGDLFDSGDVKGRFAGAAELSALLAESSLLRRCFANNYYRFAAQRQESAADTCIMQNLSTRFEQDGGSVRALMRNYVMSPYFVLRSVR